MAGGLRHFVGHGASGKQKLFSSNHALPITFTLLLSFLAVAVISSGCAYFPQSARLAVEPKVAPSEQGRGVTIAVEVLDRRMTTTIGRRGVDSEYAEITTKQNLAVLIRNALIAGFAKKGFTAIPYEGEPGRVLRVDSASWTTRRTWISGRGS